MSNDPAERKLDPESTTVTMRLDVPNWKKIDIEIPLDAAFATYTVLHSVGYEDVAQLLRFASVMSRTLVEAKVPEASLSMYSILKRFENRPTPPPVKNKKREEEAKRKNQEDLVLGFCYSLLKDGAITRGKAAEIATVLLKEPIPIDDEAWRKRVDRWAERNGRPRPGVPRKRKDPG